MKTAEEWNSLWLVAKPTDSLINHIRKIQAEALRWAASEARRSECTHSIENMANHLNTNSEKGLTPLLSRW